MWQIPVEDEIMIYLLEDSLLDLHLHLHNFGLECFIDLLLALFYQFFDILLLEVPFELLLTRNLEVLGKVIEIALKEGTCKKPDPIDFLS